MVCATCQRAVVKSLDSGNWCHVRWVKDGSAWCAFYKNSRHNVSRVELAEVVERRHKVVVASAEPNPADGDALFEQIAKNNNIFEKRDGRAL